MERVVNSVNQIITECKNMISETEHCEFVDVKNLAASLSEKCKELEAFYNEHPEEEREITIKKAAVEELAIRLEFYMDVRLDLYKERRRLRIMAQKIYEDLSDALYDKVHKQDNESASKLGISMKWALSFLSRSKHILFEKGPEDEREMRLVSELLN